MPMPRRVRPIKTPTTNGATPLTSGRKRVRYSREGSLPSRVRGKQVTEVGLAAMLIIGLLMRARLRPFAGVS